MLAYGEASVVLHSYHPSPPPSTPMRHPVFTALLLASCAAFSACAADAPVAAQSTAMTPSASDLPDSVKQHGFAIGCQAWSFNQFTAYEAIEKTAQAGGSVIEFFPGQRLSKDDHAGVGENLSAAQIAGLKAQLDKFHIQAANFGVVDIPKDEAQARKLFAFAKTMGMYGITTESTGAIDTIEKMVKEFDIHVGFHDHPRRANDPNYKMWDPNYILSVVKGRDRRIGACADVGHWATSGVRPLDAIKILDGRIMSMHFKERPQFGKYSGDVAGGLGIQEFPAIFKELKRQGFHGNISIEFENHWDHSVPEIAQCIGYVRGIGAALELDEKETAK